jgi:RNA polymerase sigma-70 factor (ECF subfamily)
VREARPRFEPPDEHADTIASAFITAAATGDVEAFASLLAEDAVLYTDGGGKRVAALNPIYGRDRIVRFYVGVSGKRGTPTKVTPARINGLPGYVLVYGDETHTVAFEVHGGSITQIYAVSNPDKLTRVTPA